MSLVAGTTYFRQSGPSDGPLVVLVPGATLATWVWGALESQLAQAGYRVIAYDLYGRGLSDRPHTRYDMGLYLSQLEQLLDYLAPGRSVSLISVAFGTLITADFTRRHPQRVNALVAMGPDGFGVHMTKASRSLLLQVPLLRDYVFALIGNRVLLDRLPDYSDNNETIVRLTEHYTPELATVGFKRAVLSSVQHMPIHDATSLYQEAGQVCQRVLLIWGTPDRVTPMPPESVIRSCFPAAQIVALPGAGHLPHWDAPEACRQHILRFLSRAS